MDLIASRAINQCGEALDAVPMESARSDRQQIKEQPAFGPVNLHTCSITCRLRENGYAPMALHVSERVFASHQTSISPD
jgi:hypothetical protein